MSSDLEARLRAAIDERAHEITPGPMLGTIAPRIHRGRGRRGAGAAVAAAGMVAAVTLGLSTGVLPRFLSPSAAVPAAQAKSGSVGSWTSKTAALPPAPLTPRRDPAAAWTGSQVLVWGG